MSTAKDKYSYDYYLGYVPESAKVYISELQAKNKESMKVLENIKEACRPESIVNQEWVYLKIVEFLEKYQ